ncbi:2-oxoglutarate dehydrogenase, putative, partial [Eimeria maxima]
MSNKGSSSRRSPFSAAAARLSGAASSGSTGGGGGAGADAGSDGFLSGTGASYAEQMLIAWRRDPSSVHASWAAYFANLEAGMPPSLCFVPPPSLQHSAAAGGGAAGEAAGAGASGAVGIGGLKALGVPSASSVSVSSPPGAGGGGATGGAIGGAAGGGTDLGESAGTAAEGSGLLALYEDAPQSVHDTSRLIQMVRGYQTRGHELASIDPLCLPRKPPYCSVRAAQQPLHLAPEHYGFTAADLEKVFVTRVPGMQGFLSPASPPRRLRDLLKRLQETYCSSLGVEYMHISDSNACNFLRQRLETDQAYAFSRESRRKILARLARAQLFENFCATKFSTTRRFGLDGCETLIVGMKAITKRAVASGLESVVIGMAHRGRLNVLVNVLHKPMQQILSEFQGVSGYGGSEWGNTGDVKYHLGVEFDLFDRDLQRNIHMCVLPNPSHLEAVDPLVLGLTRAQQYFRRDSERSLVLPIIVHGDASLAGQGVVYETLQMSSLPGYCVGGAIHLVVNNQIGFTTNPVDAGSGKYCTDIAKAVEAPILHVNADDPEAVSFACELALEFRQKFKHDVFVDIVGYRRFGHNELDMPKFTQPLTYTLIARKKTALELYSNKLIQQ